MPVIVRSALPADRQSITSLDALVTSASGPELEPFTLTEEEIQITHDHADRAGMQLLVAEADDQVVGFAFASVRLSTGGALDRSSTVFLLRRLAVSESERMNGVGAALLNELERRVSTHPRSMLQAHVPSSAIPFYRAVGWNVVEPALALGWIEAPTLAVWEAMRAQGLDPGPRRKMTFLRTEDPSADTETGFDSVAFKVLRPDLITEIFKFDFTGAPSSLIAAMQVLASQIRSDPRRMRTLPPDVSRLIFDMVLVPALGREEADRLRRG